MELVHHRHDRAVRSLGVGLEVDDLLLLLFQRGADPVHQVAGVDLHVVDVELLVPGHVDDGLLLRVRLVDDVIGRRQRDVHALLQQRRDEHHDDEEHQHDVDERGDVDLGDRPALFGYTTHCHIGSPARSRPMSR